MKIESKVTKTDSSALRAVLAAISLAAGLASTLYAAYATWRRMDGPTVAAIATLESLPDRAPDAGVWVSSHTGWVVAKEDVRELKDDLPGYRQRIAEMKPRTGTDFTELVALLASMEQATPAWRIQDMDVRSVGTARVDVNRLIFSRIERIPR